MFNSIRKVIIRFNRLLWFSKELIILPLRFTNLFAMGIHGLGHAIMLFSCTGKISVFSWHNIFEETCLQKLLISLLPAQPFPQFSAHPPQISNHLLSKAQCRWVGCGGITLNLLSILAVLSLFQYVPKQASLIGPVLMSYFMLSSLMTLLSWPDLYAMLTGHASYFACGPAFAIRYKITSNENYTRSGLASERLLDLVEILSREAATRGGQSGGFSFIAKKNDALSIVFDKVVKGKRQDIVRVLCQRLSDLLMKAKREGYVKPGHFEAILLHLRYATGGATHWHNAQPHWYEYEKNMLHHRIENGVLVSSPREVFNMIAHNGDMDGVYMNFSVNGKSERHFFSQLEARAVFLAMMPYSSSKGNSDSRSVAEWVDFHLTCGLAFKALRYAFFTAALDFNAHITNGQFNFQPLYEWAEIVDSCLITAKKTRINSHNPVTDQLDAVDDSLKSALLHELGTAFLKTMSADTTQRFLFAFEEAFFRHDLTWVMQQASRNLVGEFALMICTTLEPRIGVFSLTQAFSIGHNHSRGEIFGSAEPQGVTSSLHSGSEDDDAQQINLEDGQFAIIDFINSDSDNDTPIKIYDRATEKDSSTFTKQSGFLIQDCNNADSQYWFPVNNNHKIERTTRKDNPEDPIASDLKDIPFVLKRIVKSFQPGGENIETMIHFCNCLFRRLNHSQSNDKTFDLVLFGVDFNQDLIIEFAHAVKAILPTIKINAENSGNILKEMKRASREGVGNYGNTTLFLAVSNSAQTQSTLATLRKAVQWAGTENCFVITQFFLNSMSQALGQCYRPEDPILPNTFVNLSHLSPDGSSGRRRAEAATIVPIATQAVLTEILMFLTQRSLEQQLYYRNKLVEDARLITPTSKIELSDVMAFRQFQAVVYGVEIPNRIGYNSAGQAISSPDRVAIECEALARAENTIEFVRSYAIFSAYIIFATVFGLPIFAVLSTPFNFIHGVSLIAHLLDAFFFLSALWLIHLILRYIQGRPLLERIGARPELYIDRGYIARMVERYNATLFANAPAFLTPFFYWADTVQDALHRYGIRAHRGVVTIHRTPDERLGIEEANNAAEENMVFAQIGGIRFNGGQPQSRDKVRFNSKYMNRTHQDYLAKPFQTVLSDSLENLRTQYDQKLSPEMLRFINRRLIDLSDGLIFEFVVGNQRKNVVNQSVWDVIRWLPGAVWIYHLVLNYGIDLKRIIGDADTANQAQIQSTKHPVSPLDSNTITMSAKSAIHTLCNKQTERTETEEKGFAILEFFDNQLAINFHGNFPADWETPCPPVIILRPGRFSEKGKLVNVIYGDKTERYFGVLRHTNNKEYLDINRNGHHSKLSIPLNLLDEEQQAFLKSQLGVRFVEEYPLASF